ncbi:winged helix-turn-helix transcriptional regulator [Candidatus Bathyarchaeota archaeon]|nr:winged helix-turn-helix transcriptional regulator [Candidatus Bathyarchaeota archaeon]
MRDIEFKVLSELMNDSRRSDRALAKAIGASQPTVTRTRKRLEREGYVQEYTIIPNFTKLGYVLLALTFFKYEQSFDEEKVEKAKKILQEAFHKGPFEIIMAERGIGCGYNAVMISIHRDYTSYSELMNWAKQFGFTKLAKTESFLVNLSDKVHYRSLTFSTLAKRLATQHTKEE